MTVTYTAEVATCRGLGCFLKLLLRWRASIYKLVWLDLAVFLFVYYMLSGIYRFALNDHQKRTFEDVVKYCNEYNNLIPLSFVLGFYVNIVMTRWWNQYSTIAWPDSIAVFVSATVHGNDERGRLMRRTIVRYVCVCLTLVLTNVSPRVKKRFPTLDHFVDAGLLLENELIIFQNLNSKFPKPSKYWLPIVWAASIVTRARKEGRIRDDFAVKTLIDELNQFRAKCGRLLQYDTISIPLVYTQVVTLAVYTYFLSSVMGRQWVEEKIENTDNSSKYLSKIDLYFPVFTTLQFFFYMGWLKVAETLINPFGEDDDDFDVNWIIDRNLQVSYLIVDEMHHDHPELIRDQYWDEIFPVELPYTTASQPFREEHPIPSTAGIQLSAAQQEFHPSSVKIDEMNPESIYSNKFRNDVADDAASGIHFTAGKMSRSGSRISTRDRIGSTSSNIGGSLTRVNSVTSVLRRLFSKEDRLDGNLSNSGGSKTPGRLPDSSSSASLQNQNRYQSGPGGSMRIGVIEEVDEQLTISSIRPPENRPHVQNIFSYQGGPPRPSSPVDVPENKGRNGKLLSSSAPAATLSRYRPRSSGFRSASGGDDDINFSSDINISDNHGATARSDPQDNISLRSSCSSTSTDSNDDFMRLKLERDKERKNRAIRKLSRNNPSGDNSFNSNNPNNDDMDSETLLLTELAEASKLSLKPSSDRNNQSDNV